MARYPVRGAAPTIPAVKPRVLLSIAFALCAGAAHADIYSYKSAEGVTVFTDRPPADRPYEVLVKDPLTRPAAEPVRTRVLLAVPLQRNRYAVHVDAAAQASHVDPALIHAVISAESGYNARAQSPKGAVGLMQLMPDTARRYRVSDRLDPAQNIHGGARYLADLLQMFNNDLSLTLAAYNAGEKAVMKYGNRIPPYPETAAYVPRVLAYYRRYLGRP
jgi:soluble lytic murein transglycosylase-like protein